MSNRVRDEMIVYLVDWATRFKAELRLSGECGFGRPCMGIYMFDHWIDTENVVHEHYMKGAEWWEPKDSYHKHDCMAVLIHGDGEEAQATALFQLYDWVKWIDAHNLVVRTRIMKHDNYISFMIHGHLLPYLARS